MRAERHSEADTPQEIGSIREYLMWVTVLKYFEHGHSDKTMEMLNTLIENEKMNRPSKAKEPNSKKMFETDCKICFCSFNNDSNQVLYCDECNTSFHLACYGLQQIPKEDVYYCECCRFQKKELAKKMSCQLCCRSNFPVKQLEGHFYHVTCLILFNLGNSLPTQPASARASSSSARASPTRRSSKWSCRANSRPRTAPSASNPRAQPSGSGWSARWRGAVGARTRSART
jgi:hypothetical protein